MVRFSMVKYTVLHIFLDARVYIHRWLPPTQTVTGTATLDTTTANHRQPPSTTSARLVHDVSMLRESGQSTCVLLATLS